MEECAAYGVVKGTRFPQYETVDLPAPQSEGDYELAVKECAAYGVVESAGFQQYETVTLTVPQSKLSMEECAAYGVVEGPPDSVSDLTGYQLDSCCMFISWYPPFTLPRLTVQYIISVGTDQQYLNDSITNYTYCPMNPIDKQYLFNITTTNKVGNGSTSNITVGFQSTNVELYVTDQERGNVNWTFHFIVSVHQFCSNVPPLMNITLKGCTKDNCYSTTNVSTSNSSYNNISLVVQFPSNKTLNTNATLYYQNGVTVQSNTITISTHDLNLTLINVTSNSVCVQFQFVNGSTLYIDYIHIIDSQGQFHWDDLKPFNDSLNFIKCFGDIPVGNNLTLYACEFETFYENCISNPPAVITGINITNVSTSSVLMSSVHSSSVSLTSTVLTTPSMMSLEPLIISTLSASTSTIPTSSALTTSLAPTALKVTTTSSALATSSSVPATVSTTSTVQQVTSSSIISSTTDTPTISSSTRTTRLTSTLVTATSTATPSSVLVPSSITSSSITFSSLSSLSPTSLPSSLSSSSKASSLSPMPSSITPPLSSSSLSLTLSSVTSITSSSPTPSLTAPSSISSSLSIIQLVSGISIALLIITIVVIVIVVVTATVQFKKRRGRMEVSNDVTLLKRNENNNQSTVIYLFIYKQSLLIGSQEQELSLVNPQYENVHLPVPQSELSMEECAAYGVVEGTRFPQYETVDLLAPQSEGDYELPVKEC
uniref:Fibronectin type-III domain-containing protein n=1 Tax=Amphimedon queenslandica TaxID=400682 RepID=A0A1X7V1P8_AMPQE